MTNNQFRQQLDTLHLKPTEAGAALGLSSATIWNYLNGKYPVPKYITLALEALTHRKHLDKSMYDV